MTNLHVHKEQITRATNWACQFKNQFIAKRVMHDYIHYTWCFSWTNWFLCSDMSAGKFTVTFDSAKYLDVQSWKIHALKFLLPFLFLHSQFLVHIYVYIINNIFYIYFEPILLVFSSMLLRIQMMIFKVRIQFFLNISHFFKKNHFNLGSQKVTYFTNNISQHVVHRHIFIQREKI